MMVSSHELCPGDRRTHEAGLKREHHLLEPSHGVPAGEPGTGLVPASLGLTTVYGPHGPSSEPFLSRTNSRSAERDETVGSKTEMIMMGIYGRRSREVCCLGEVAQCK